MRFLNEIMYDCQGWIVQKTKILSKAYSSSKGPENGDAFSNQKNFLLWMG